MQVLPGTWQLFIKANPTNFRLVRNFSANKKIYFAICWAPATSLSDKNLFQ